MAFINQCYYLMCPILILIIGYSANTLPHPLDGNNITLSMRDKHERWMATYGRTYKDMAEKEKRLQIFKENVEHIESFNRASPSNHILYTLGVNEFADMTDEEFIDTYTSSKTFSPLQSMYGGAATTNLKYANVTDAPPSMDWRTKGAVTPIQRQKRCSSCWAFATVATIEGLNQIKTGSLMPLSAQDLVDCDRTNYGCKGGNFVTAFKFVYNSKGIIEEKAYPYTGKQGKCQTPQGQVVTIRGYEGVPTRNEDALLHAVSKQPVAVAMSSAGLKLYKGGIFNANNCGNTLSGHAVTIIGYGTEQGIINGTRKEIDYWLVKNSWGKRWGEKGYFRVLRGHDICGISEMPYYPI